MWWPKSYEFLSGMVTPHVVLAQDLSALRLRNMESDGTYVCMYVYIYTHTYTKSIDGSMDWSIYLILSYLTLSYLSI